MNDFIVPILLKSQIELVFKKLLYLGFSKDGSIYIIMPLRPGYQIYDKKDIFPDMFNKKVRLNKENKLFKNPKISFHPREKTVHVKANQNEYFLNSCSTFNMAEDDKQEIFPLCSFLFPKQLFQALDLYKEKNSHKNKLELTTVEKLVSLGVEIWIHNNGSHLDIDTYPNKTERKNLRVLTYLNPILNAKYSISIAFWDDDFSKIQTNPRVLVSVFNDDKPIVFSLKF